MSTYPLPEYLSDFHDGNEWAIAAIMGSRVVALLYVADITPEIARHLDTPAAEFVIKRWAQSSPTDLLELRQLGDVSAGIVSAEGFSKHWSL